MKAGWLFLTVVLGTASLTTPARAWGPDGHQIVARIAELHLSADAKAELAALLPDAGLSDSNHISDTRLASFADFVRHNSHFPQYAQSGPWHFVDIPISPDGPVAYDPQKHCKDGQCVLEQIEGFQKVLADKTQPKKKRQEALVFLVHFVGDMSQPLHCATRNDRGGNDVKVHYLGQSGNHLNLHSVWDDNLVRENMASFDAIKAANQMNEAITDADVAEWQGKTTKDWMLESYELARTSAYRVTPNGEFLATTGTVNLGSDYVKANAKVAGSQLRKGGVRLAKVLNDALKP
ncbi:S1/P1 nuclease [Limnoglobus roseus]|nr:S1/P1 nuclease [Limnoglobus roseus]